MSDDKSKRHADGKLISLTEDYEVRDWCKALNVTPQRLRELVAECGPSAAAVRARLAANP